ncbi:hypothetical protein PENSPDRAFT_747042 [Peniophora sp. CONT]|nr:hypothetical protein PENSPDRAFT_747042 [Peniophora sp. CONT]
MAAAIPIASLPASDPTSAPFPTFKSAPALKTNSPAVKPNNHPYAIKTTSTGALARSNSSSAAASVRHHYIPSPSPRSPERSNSKSEYRGHRYSTSISGSSDRLQLSPTRSERSLSEDSNSGLESPAPLPSPGPRRSKRAETLPTVDTATAANIAAFAAGVTAQASIEDLPSNPKQWTPAQLSAYLVRALRVRSASGEAAVAAPVAKDIAAWVRAQSITGRVFLRWTEEDLEILGTNILWRSALLTASRNLRQNVIRGRIWGPSTSPTDSPFQTSELYNSASSTESLNADDTGSSPGARLRRRNAGRVKGLVNRWETASQSGSESENESELPASLSSFTSFHPHSAPANRTAFTGIESDPTPWPSSAIGEDDEPTMEELLAAGEDKKGSWGARAWETMDGGIQETVKRAIGEGEKELPPPPYASPLAELDEKEQGWDTIVPRRDGSGSSSGSTGFAGSAKRITRSGTGTHSGRSGKKDSRRIVTAVFMPTEEMAEAQSAIVENVGQDVVPEPMKNDEEDARIRTLEAEVAASRTMLAILHARLQTVEERVAAMEADEPKAKSEQTPVQVETPAQSTGVDKVIQRAEARKAQEDESKVAKALEPYAIGDIPGYMVLVGLGVCAVVLRVVMQRVALGRRS